MTKLDIKPQKGTRDWFPEDLIIRNFIFNTWREVVESFGFKEYDAPILESLELYKAKSGDELASDQTYSFLDRGNREVAIRPEMTPSISRMVAARRQELAYPARLYSIANFMRYERPQRGREREFWQLNVDIFGDESVYSDVEALLLADELLQRFGATKDMYEIRVNSRELIDFILKDYGQLEGEKAHHLMKLLDNREKMSEDTFLEEFSNLDLDDSSRKLLEVFNIQSIDELPSEVKETGAFKRLEETINRAQEINIESVRFDMSLMRGLDYYTGLVFEVFDKSPENNRALFGGGRYDGLVGLFGVDPLSAIGFAPGLSTVELFLKSHNLIPELSPRVEYYIASLSPLAELVAMRLAKQLRQNGHVVEVDASGRKPDKLIKTALKKGVVNIIFIGEDELSSGVCQIKNLRDGQEVEISLA